MLNSQNGLLMTPQLQKGAHLDSLITLYGLNEIITESLFTLFQNTFLLV